MPGKLASEPADRIYGAPRDGQCTHMTLPSQYSIQCARDGEFKIQWAEGGNALVCAAHLGTLIRWRTEVHPNAQRFDLTILRVPAQVAT